MNTNLPASATLDAIGWAPRPGGALGGLANLLPLAPQGNALLQLTRKGGSGAEA